MFESVPRAKVMFLSIDWRVKPLGRVKAVQAPPEGR